MALDSRRKQNLAWRPSFFIVSSKSRRRWTHHHFRSIEIAGSSILRTADSCGKPIYCCLRPRTVTICFLIRFCYSVLLRSFSRDKSTGSHHIHLNTGFHNPQRVVASNLSTVASMTPISRNHMSIVQDDRGDKIAIDTRDEVFVHRAPHPSLRKRETPERTACDLLRSKQLTNKVEETEEEVEQRSWSSDSVLRQVSKKGHVNNAAIPLVGSVITTSAIRDNMSGRGKARATSRVDSIAAALREAARQEAKSAPDLVWFPGADRAYSPPVFPAPQIARAIQVAARQELARNVHSSPDQKFVARVLPRFTAEQSKSKVGTVKQAPRRKAHKSNSDGPHKKATAAASSNLAITPSGKGEDPYAAQLVASGMTHDELMRRPVEQLDLASGKMVRWFRSGDEARVSVTGSKFKHKFVYALLGRNKGGHVYRGYFWRLKGSRACPMDGNPKNRGRSASKAWDIQATAATSGPRTKAVSVPHPVPASRTLSGPTPTHIAKTRNLKSCPTKRQKCTDDPLVAELMAAGKSRDEILQLPVEELDRETGAVIRRFSSGLKAFQKVSNNPRKDVFYHVLLGLPYERRNDNPRTYKNSYWRLKGSKISPELNLPVLRVDEHLRTAETKGPRPSRKESLNPRTPPPSRALTARSQTITLTVKRPPSLSKLMSLEGPPKKKRAAKSRSSNRKLNDDLASQSSDNASEDSDWNP